MVLVENEWHGFRLPSSSQYYSRINPTGREPFHIRLNSVLAATVALHQEYLSDLWVWIRTVLSHLLQDYHEVRYWLEVGWESIIASSRTSGQSKVLPFRFLSALREHHTTQGITHQWKTYTARGCEEAESVVAKHVEKDEKEDDKIM